MKPWPRVTLRCLDHKRSDTMTSLGTIIKRLLNVKDIIVESIKVEDKQGLKSLHIHLKPSKRYRFRCSCAKESARSTMARAAKNPAYGVVWTGAVFRSFYISPPAGSIVPSTVSRSVMCHGPLPIPTLHVLLICLPLGWPRLAVSQPSQS